MYINGWILLSNSLKSSNNLIELLYAFIDLFMQFIYIVYLYDLG